MNAGRGPYSSTGPVVRWIQRKRAKNFNTQAVNCCDVAPVTYMKFRIRVPHHTMNHCPTTVLKVWNYVCPWCPCCAQLFETPALSFSSSCLRRKRVLSDLLVSTYVSMFLENTISQHTLVSVRVRLCLCQTRAQIVHAKIVTYQTIEYIQIREIN